MVRVGLVVIGLAFVIVGGGLVASFFLFSSSSPPGAVTRTVTASQILPDQSQVWPLQTVGSGQGSVALAWTANGRSNVTFVAASACQAPGGWCADGPLLAHWPYNLSGSWHGSGSLPPAYLLTVTDRSSGEIAFNATLTESYPGTTFGLGSIDLILVTIAIILLLATGAIGVFLGLFLPGGVYRNPPGPVRSRFEYDVPDEDDRIEPDDDEDLP